VEVAIDDHRIQLRLLSLGLTLAWPRLEEPGLPRRVVRLFGKDTEGVDAGPEAAELFSDYLGERCALVYMPDAVTRPVEPDYAAPADRVGFADGFPLLVASLASLADLNERLATAGSPPVPMTRFRPNIVLDDLEPWAEERAARAVIPARGLVLRTPKKCARCQVTTVDQDTAATGKEPLRTLASFRTEKNKVNFAVNAIPDVPRGGPPAILAVGDEVELL
jgi:uncharacterized protein YcbX